MVNKHNKRTEYDMHHLVNRCNGGSDFPSNLVRIKRKKHEAWHILFENMGFKEVLLEVFLMGEKCLKDGTTKRLLFQCLKDINYKGEVFK